ncbi:hypothetical protein ASZ90_016465 [hydrocarbon metagenome]|uniref:Uncharacterized protein n=1 Tax=hydrocarbon metagenome TaxID=938273 RepID=A0A0W8ESH2_9ZZZZ
MDPSFGVLVHRNRTRDPRKERAPPCPRLKQGKTEINPARSCNLPIISGDR